MFENVDLLYIFGPAMVITTITMVILIRLNNKKDIPKKDKAIFYLQTMLVSIGILLIILWLLIPSNVPFGAYGYPLELSDIDTEEKKLRLFREYNFAFYRSLEIFRWFLFLFIWWFLTSLYAFVNAFKTKK